MRFIPLDAKAFGRGKCDVLWNLKNVVRWLKILSVNGHMGIQGLNAACDGSWNSPIRILKVKGGTYVTVMISFSSFNDIRCLSGCRFRGYLVGGKFVYSCLRAGAINIAVLEFFFSIMPQALNI